MGDQGIPLDLKKNSETPNIKIQFVKLDFTPHA